MKKAYENMRAFWLDAKNFESRKGVIEIGPDKIIAAGVEMGVFDGKEVKCILVAANSLGDISLYFENNSTSGVGGFIGGNRSEALQETAAHMLAYAGKLSGQMTLCADKNLPPPAEHGQVVLFALAKDKLFSVQLSEAQARTRENPFFPMFAYSQQVIGHFKKMEEEQTPQGKA